MLYYIQNWIKEVVILQLLIHAFFISFIINIFLIIYSVYSEIDFILLRNQQGSKLKFKRKEFKIWKEF